MSGQHWTSRSTKDFVYRISSDFAFQIEHKMNEEPISQSELAKRIGVSDGRVSQVLRNPGNLTLKNMVEYARALGMKVAIVAYDDDDPTNKNGPINSRIFTACWKKVGKPNDFFAFHESLNTIRIIPSIQYLSHLDVGHFEVTPGNSTLTQFGLLNRSNTTRNFLVPTSE